MSNGPPLDFEVMSPDDPRAVEALTKAPHGEVHYGPAKPGAEKRCDRCAMFKPAKVGEHGVRDVDGCTSVRGLIFADWVCDLFEPGVDAGEAKAEQ